VHPVNNDDVYEITLLKVSRTNKSATGFFTAQIFVVFVF